jgi:hypothetical protein
VSGRGLTGWDALGVGRNTLAKPGPVRLKIWFIFLARVFLAFCQHKALGNGSYHSLQVAEL